MLPRFTETTLLAYTRARLDRDGLTYCTLSPLGPKPLHWISICSLVSQAKIYVEVTDRYSSRVRFFRSRATDVTLDARMQGIPVLDMTDAFALAQDMTRQWPKARPDSV